MTTVAEAAVESLQRSTVSVPAPRRGEPAGPPQRPARPAPRPAVPLHRRPPLRLAVADGLAALLALALVGAPTWSAALALGWVGLVAASRGYEPAPAHSLLEHVRRVVRAWTACVLVGVVLSVTVGVAEDVSRLLVFATLVTVLSVAHRTVALAVTAWGHGRGTRAAYRVVVAGRSREVAAVIEELRRTRRHGLEVVGACVKGRADRTPPDVPASSGLGNLASVVAETAADVVIVLPCKQLDPATLRRLAWELEDTGAHLLVSPGLRDVAVARATVTAVGGLDVLHVRAAELRGWRRAVKEGWERTAAAVALLLLLPLLVALVVAVRIETPGPAVFRQVRIGRHDRPFTMYKLRTMCDAADQRRDELAASNDADGVLFKVRADPRVTRVGRVLRRYSLDELPQLVNVVLGHMSLVGPRPPLPAEVAQYADDVRRRLAVKPGVTGLWQVSGRSDLAWDEAVRLDLSYVDNWSLGLDLRILALTARAVLAHRGAY